MTNEMRELKVDELDSVAGGCMCQGPYCSGPCNCGNPQIYTNESNCVLINGGSEIRCPLQN